MPLYDYAHRGAYGSIMAYFVTGATGFIGRHFIGEIALHGEPIHVLVRPRAALDRLVRSMGLRASLIVPIEGDLTAPVSGVSASARELLRGKIDHFVHLGALYDLDARAGDLECANVSGTRHALDLALDLKAGCFHHVSSIAVAGRYSGVFTEHMFDEACGLEHPYFRTKHEAEALVRGNTALPWRIYRPGMVVGHSQSGEMDKIDGPYYFFKLIQKIRDKLPAWAPLVGVDGGHINLVPVDFVAAALAHLVHAPGQDGKCFHLTDPRDLRIGAVLNMFAKAAHAPTMSLRLDLSLLDALASSPAARETFGLLREPLRRVLDRLLRDFGIPDSVVSLVDYPTRFDCAEAQKLLVTAGIRVPKLEDYAWRLWDYWERQLDPQSCGVRSLSARLSGKTVLITGGSSGIGLATALKLAPSGARLLIVGRDGEKLNRAVREIEASGCEVGGYVCDIADPEACDRLIARLRAEHGHIDVLINNAGRSIRRAVEHTYDRLHDYERLMRINYFGAVRLTLGLLPGMVEHGGGHVISVSSIGAISHAARFAAYNASKAALEAFTRCAAAEYADRNVSFTVINMPLVRTPMVAPTKIYDRMHLLQPDQAAELVCEALIHRPARLTTGLGTAAQLAECLLPALNTAFMSENFKMFPESGAADGIPESAPRPTAEAAAFAALMRGIHW
jgi:NAD(P)-dependent dehydrogenase (short-subunit alcohol dehydrogenase family)